MLAIFAPVVSWIFRELVLKFVIFTSLYALLAVLIPKGIAIAAPYLGVQALNNAFGSLDSAVWFYLDFFAFGYGLPLVLAAYSARFLIRRLPVIG